MSDLALRAIELSDMVKALRRELALAQEARLAAELRAEGLQEKLRNAVRSHENHACPLSRTVYKVITDPPADLGPLRDHARAVGALLAELESAPWHCGAEADVAGKHAALLAAYPFLDPGAEPAKEVTRG